MRELLVENIRGAASPIFKLADALMTTATQSSVPQRYKSEAIAAIEGLRNRMIKAHLEQALEAMIQLIDELEIDHILNPNLDTERAIESEHSAAGNIVSLSQADDDLGDLAPADDSDCKPATARWKTGGQVRNRNLQKFLKRVGYRQNSGGNGELIFTRQAGCTMQKISVPNHPSDDVAFQTLAKILRRLEEQLGAEIQVCRGQLVMTKGFAE